MTREELIEQYVEANPYCNWWGAGELRDLLNSFAKELQGLQPPLPEGLDEAAEKFAFNSLDEVVLYGCTLSGRRACFIAGADWVARQGATLKVTDDTTWGEVNDFIHRNCDGAKEIQIRKK